MCFFTNWQKRSRHLNNYKSHIGEVAKMNNLNKMYLPLRGPNWPCTLQGPIFVGREHIPSRQGYFAKQFTTSWLQAVVGPPQKKNIFQITSHRVIPTVTLLCHRSELIWKYIHIYIYGIYFLTFFSGNLSDNLLWHYIWHLL